MTQIKRIANLKKEIIIEITNDSLIHNQSANIQIKDDAGNVLCKIEAVIVEVNGDDIGSGSDERLYPIIEFRH